MLDSRFFARGAVSIFTETRCDHTLDSANHFSGRKPFFPNSPTFNIGLSVTAHLLPNAVVTQLGECKTEDLEVAGSSPAHGTLILAIRRRSMY
jgi:hypothetical protein